MELVEVDWDQIKECKYCGQLIAWMKSTRTGKSYPLNYNKMKTVGSAAAVVKMGDFHNCRPIPLKSGDFKDD